RALREDVPVPRLDHVEHLRVDATEKDRAVARVRIDERIESLGALEVLARTLALKSQESADSLVDRAAAQIVLADAEALEVLARKIDPIAVEILADIAKDIRELHGEAEILGGSVRGVGAVIAEDLEADPPDHRGRSIAVEPEIGEGLVAADREIHEHAFGELLEEAPLDRIAGERVAERRHERVIRGSLADERAQPIEPPARFVEGGWAIAFDR